MINYPISADPIAITVPNILHTLNYTKRSVA